MLQRRQLNSPLLDMKKMCVTIKGALEWSNDVTARKFLS